MLVSLQCTDSPSLSNRTFDSCLEGTSLAVTIAENHHLSSCHNGTNTYCEGCSWYCVHIATEETGVSDAGIISQIQMCIRDSLWIVTPFVGVWIET